MNLQSLNAISPIDGRYRNKVQELAPYFSEWALIAYRVRMEVLYFIEMVEIPLPGLESVPQEVFPKLHQIYQDFSLEEAEKVKAIERKTNHDVKAVEYYLKEQFASLGLQAYDEFIHFGLTSQDINNTAIPLSLLDFMGEIYIPLFQKLIDQLVQKAKDWEDIAMLARTHGQAASPTRLGKEIMVFGQRLQLQLDSLKEIPFAAKFGGATGNFNAHFVAYPGIDWVKVSADFLAKLGLKRSHPTTQIEHYDYLASLLDNAKRINTILIDFARDIWHYISIDYFKQKIVAGEVGSSTMPHKVNPIDFENAEGNLGMANAIFTFLSAKLPISRLQRDLTDSTVLRNLGLPFAHSLIALKSLEKGLSKLELNPFQIAEDLEQNWAVVGEAIQTVLRREGYPQPYEALKALTRQNNRIDKESMHQFIDGLAINEELKEELKRIEPNNYLGIKY